MDFQTAMTNARAEALRWLGIAEKLLNSRDLVGSKTFAIRARESDPSFEPADQILAVVDTLMAGEKRINNQPDWYAILQLYHQTQDAELIATQFRLLALLLNPQTNRAPFVDQAFRLVVDAWSVLSNPWKKSIYDNELNLYSRLDSDRREPQGPQHKEPQHKELQQPPQHKEPQEAQQQHLPKNNNYVENERNAREETPIRSGNDQSPNFWTACPYCYCMYKYPSVYVECSLRCQNCLRAFHAVTISSPPPIVDGKETYFSCWCFFPMGVSMSNLEKNKVGVSNWNPFSHMFACPQELEKNGVKRNLNVKKSSAPPIYVDDVFVEISDSSEDSGDVWGRTGKIKKAKSVKGKGSTGKNAKKPEKAKNVKVGSGENLQGGFVMQESVGAPPNISTAESSKKVAANNAKKRAGKVQRDLGKLDLNVEFSNEVEEPAPRTSQRNGAGNGEEDNIEGIGFFEGLDEFLSSLPILNVASDDKVKTA